MPISLAKITSEGVVWMASSSVINKLFGVVYVVLVLSTLSVYDYGVVELLLSIPPLLGILSLPGLENVIVADMGREKGNGEVKKMRYLFDSYFSVRVLLAVLAWCVLFFSAPFVEQAYNEAIATMLRVLSFTFLFSPLRTLYVIIFRVSLRYDLIAIHRFVEEAAKLATLAFCLLVLGMGSISVIIAYIATDLVALPLLSLPFISSCKQLFGNIKVSAGWKDPLYTIKTHGKWSVFGTYLDMFGQNIRPWIIKYFLGTHAVAIYAVALGMYQNTASLIPVNQVVSPLVPQYIHKQKVLFQLLNSAVKYQLAASVTSSMVMVIAMPVLIHFFFPDYAESYILFVALLATSIPASFSTVYQSVFFALKAQRNLFYANVLRLTSIVLLLPGMLATTGLYGLAIESFITATIFSYNRFRRVHSLLPEFRFSFTQLMSVTDTDRLLLDRATKKVRRIFARVL